MSERKWSLEEAVDTVEWKGSHGAGFNVDRKHHKLEMTIWVRDTEDPDNEELVGLIGKRDITDHDGRDQVRAMIHQYLCHEADEQLEFGGERPFYPEHPLTEELVVA
jgi:acetone carboxylase gamma subunit